MDGAPVAHHVAEAVAASHLTVRADALEAVEHEEPRCVSVVLRQAEVLTTGSNVVCTLG
jgi:hypothetical protein